MQLDKVRAIVTGGASGLGHAVAKHLVAHGGKVALFDVNEEKGQAAAKELGDAARFFKADVTSEDGVVANVAAAREAMGGLNVVMNCAGILGAGRVLGKQGPMPLKTFAGTVMVNLVGSFNVAKAGAALMQSNEAGEDGERGVIVNTASIAAYEGQIGQAAYSASKGGIVAMTLPMAREFARIGVRVMTIAPGIFWTPMVDGMPPQVQESLSASIPFPSRLGR
ncbi:MAG: SDR family NAD(P)-dependent oxidoreductase, partial [Burkholderiales bacterium]